MKAFRTNGENNSQILTEADTFATTSKDTSSNTHTILCAEPLTLQNKMMVAYNSADNHLYLVSRKIERTGSGHWATTPQSSFYEFTENNSDYKFLTSYHSGNYFNGYSGFTATKPKSSGMPEDAFKVGTGRAKGNWTLYTAIKTGTGARMSRSGTANYDPTSGSIYVNSKTGDIVLWFFGGRSSRFPANSYEQINIRLFDTEYLYDNVLNTANSTTTASKTNYGGFLLTGGTLITASGGFACRQLGKSGDTISFIIQNYNTGTAWRGYERDSSGAWYLGSDPDGTVNLAFTFRMPKYLYKNVSSTTTTFSEV